MRAIPIKRTNSGIEPIDRLLGGLQVGKPYLVHGDAVSASLCGTQFLVEGLKHGESVGLVTGQPMSAVVEAFARFGHPCLEEIYDGKLAVVRSGDDLSRKVSGLPGLASVLIELECVLGDRLPDRLVVEAIGDLIGEESELESRAHELASWAACLGSTSLLLAAENAAQAVSALRPLVAESFRFEVKRSGGMPTHFLILEKKTPSTAALIQVSPNRGILMISPDSKNAYGG